MNARDERKSEGVVPPAAAAVIALLNSRAHAIHPDALDSPETALFVLPRLGHGVGVSEQQLRELRALRSDLMAVLSAEHDGEDADPSWAAFTARTAALTFQAAFASSTRVDLRQISGSPLAGRVALLVADLIGSGQWFRLRACANDECATVFYDTTRNRSRRWHSYDTCGNKRNVSAYRSRARSASGVSRPTSHR